MDTTPQNPLAIKNKITTYLAIRDHSVKELREKLSQFFTLPEIIWGLEWALKQGYLKEPNELADQVARRLHEKNKSFLFILHYLRKKGLPAIEKNDELELEKCRKVLETKIGFEHENLTSNPNIAKMHRVLSLRGFDNETIRKVTHEKYRAP
jgi:SOS response regulatory protein OraA/RecX